MAPDATIRVAVAAHKPYRMPDDPVYLPLHVGRALHPEAVSAMGPGFVGDDTGDSISALNASYSELTGLWWVWRNLDADYRGLVHYRRHFASADPRRRHARDRFARIASGDDFRLALSKAPVIVPRARDYVIETVESHYVHTMEGAAQQVAAVRAAVRDARPAYAEALEAQLGGTRAHMFNMLVMRADLLDGYCSWLFPLLAEAGERVDSSRYDAFGARWPGRVSEWLLDVWLRTNGVPCVEMPTTSPEPVNWARKGSAFLAAKFLGRTYGGSF